jgi:hypothetical protein
MDPVSNGVRPGIGQWVTLPAMLFAMRVTTGLFGIGISGSAPRSRKFSPNLGTASDHFRPFYIGGAGRSQQGARKSSMIFQKTL